MTARDAILASLAPDTATDATAIAQEAAALLDGIERPPIDDGAVDDLFVARLSLASIAATHDHVATVADLPGAVARYLAGQNAEPALYLPPDPRLDAADWSRLTRLAHVPVDGGTALAWALAGVAETGSLILETAPHAPMLPNFLALHHIVVVERTTLVRWLEDVAPPPPPGPRTRYWVTGVSGTTDIEGQYVRGAHGPRYLHVLLLG